MKRAKPDFTGVQGEVVAGDVIAGLEGRGLAWGSGGRKSPYDAQLDELLRLTNEAAAQGSPKPAMRFASNKARTSLTVRAKKKGIKLSFAEFDGALYCRIEGQENQVGARRRARILEELKRGPRKAAYLNTALRAAGDQTIDLGTIGAILSQMLREGSIVHQEGDTWGLAPRSSSK
ncbi:MAG: hypothetical protein U0Q18_37055 [Bryobacteraceae bacterium]